MGREPLLTAKKLTKRFGPGCSRCYEDTGPEFDTNICPYCGSVVACHGIDFQLFPNEVLGVVGESGSGKSTVIHLVHFDWEPTGGELFLSPNRNQPVSNGKNLCADISGSDLLRLNPYRQRLVRNFLMGVVYQKPELGLRMTVSAGGNIAERLLMADWRNVNEMRERSAELLNRTEVPVGRMDDLPEDFSGGMQQRVQIAKALSNRPMILLLDEVTTGLDVSVQARVLDLLRQLQRELGMATIVVSHDLGVIRLLTSRTMVMKYGRVVEQGLTDQILEDPQHPYSQLLVSSVL